MACRNGCDGENTICEQCAPWFFEDVTQPKDGVILTEKPTNPNPKDLIGTNKVPLGLVPASAIAYQSLGHLEGNLKYGLVNWRDAGVRTMIYIDALLRHTAKFVNGEWCDPLTKVPHLGSMGACINIIIDAYEAGKLVDDRPKDHPTSELLERLAANVEHLRQLYGSKQPKHFYHEGAVDESVYTASSRVPSRVE